MCRQSATVCLIKSPSPATRELSVLTNRLTALSDPRDRRGRRHSLVAVLLTAACAVLAGARSCLAIGQWARRAPRASQSRQAAASSRWPVSTRTLSAIAASRSQV
ncbi:transposase family protein [Streptomyces sp. NPDC017936]|uniref:transposase family protein n=1 Tax=Streptomyces sp. NPDC017936 TaxID=3365016 RepID=UPI00378A9589